MRGRCPPSIAIALAISPAFTVLAGCGDESPVSARYRIGEIERADIAEVSGIVRSGRDNDKFWLLGDGGSGAVIHAIDRKGRILQVVAVTGADNVDWEDIAAFNLEGRPALLVADIGDNDGNRPELSLYLLPEPLPEDGEVEPWRTVRFRYPDGPRDAESVIVTAAGDAALILTKRTVPAELYSVTLDNEAIPVTAVMLGRASGLPQPSRDDLELAHARQSWHWQPTAMDLSPDGGTAAILTYAGVYLFGVTGDWGASLQSAPSAVALPGLADAESLAFDGDAVLVTVEGSRAPLFRLPLSAFSPAAPGLKPTPDHHRP